MRSFTEFARAGLGDGAGFVVGWLYWYFWVLVVPVEAIAGRENTQHWLPQFTPLQIGLGLMAIMTAVNLMSARSYAEFEFWFASIKVAAIIVFIVIAASFAFGWTSPHGATFGNLAAYGGFTPHGWIAVLAAVPTVFFAMTGAEITTIAAAESAQPGRAVARMGSAVIWRILVVLRGLRILHRVGHSVEHGALRRIAVHAGPQHHARAVGRSDHERHHSDRRAFVPELRLLRQLAGAVHPGGPRRCAPDLVKLNARRVPVGSVLMGAAAGFLGIIAATEAPQAVFDFLVSSSGALVVYVYMTIGVAQITLRVRRERAGEPAPAGHDVAISLVELRGHRRHGRRAGRHGIHAGHAAGLQGQPRHLGGGGRRVRHRQAVRQPRMHPAMHPSARDPRMFRRAARACADAVELRCQVKKIGSVVIKGTSRLYRGFLAV